uniref:biotin/lipoyl-containing protein n=1 Tax=Aquiluna sp. TaxID=2053504 RepID=UPI0040486BE0
GTTSQPSFSSLVAALENTERDTGISMSAVTDLEPYWEAVRKVYSPFESGLPGPTGRVYSHEIPGGQLSNLRQQAIALGLGDRFELVEDMYAAANRILGRPPKVTPSSKVVGDLALHLVAVDADPEDFENNPQNYDIPESVIGFMAGELGDLPGGWPEPFRSKVLKGKKPDISVTPVSTDDLAALKSSDHKRIQRTLNELLFPGPTKEFDRVQAAYGELDNLETLDYLYGLEQDNEHVVELRKGLQLFVGLEAIGEADSKGFRTVMAKLNGQLRPILARDHSITATTSSAEKADPAIKGHAAAPFTGVVTPKVAVGDSVQVGDPIAGIEAMKMEASIAAPISGKIVRLGITGPTPVEGGDLIAVIE